MKLNIKQVFYILIITINYSFNSFSNRPIAKYLTPLLGDKHLDDKSSVNYLIPLLGDQSPLNDKNDKSLDSNFIEIKPPKNDLNHKIKIYNSDSDKEFIEKCLLEEINNGEIELNTLNGPIKRSHFDRIKKSYISDFIESLKLYDVLILSILENNTSKWNDIGFIKYYSKKNIIEKTFLFKNYKNKNLYKIMINYLLNNKIKNSLYDLTTMFTNNSILNQSFEDIGFSVETRECSLGQIKDEFSGKVYIINKTFYSCLLKKEILTISN